jgi:hypothetical protein
MQLRRWDLEACLHSLSTTALNGSWDINLTLRLLDSQEYTSGATQSIRIDRTKSIYINISIDI